MKNSIYFLEKIFNLNSRLFNNTLAGVSEERSAERISEHNNSYKWIATHTVWARYNTLGILGKPVPNPYNNLFEKFKPFDSADMYPSLEEIKEEWQKVTALLKEALEGVTEEHLAADSVMKSPIDDNTNGGTIAFFAEHESYDIGQLGFLKKYLTKEAIVYN
ncbi:MAG: DinB family protein [Ginsengibacter sp.]